MKRWGLNALQQLLQLSSLSCPNHCNNRSSSYVVLVVYTQSVRLTCSCDQPAVVTMLTHNRKVSIRR